MLIAQFGNIRIVGTRIEWEGEAMPVHEPHRAARPVAYVLHADRSGVAFVSVDGRPARKLTDTEKLLALTEMVSAMAEQMVGMLGELEGA